MNSNRIIVEKVVNGGYGLARKADGQVVLLRNCLPGEEVVYSVLEKRKNILFGVTNKILRPHLRRVEPPCQYYTKCGGCNLQHGSYKEQLNIKKSILSELLQQNSHICGTVIPSPREFGYRQRIRLQVRDSLPGFLQFRSKKIVHIKKCLLAHPAINSAFAATLQQLSFQKICSSAREIEYLFNPATENVILLFHLHRKPRSADKQSAQQLTDDVELVERIFFTGDSFSLEGPYCHTDEVLRDNLLAQRLNFQEDNSSLVLSWEVGGFCQVNILQNHNLISYVVEHCQETAGKNILDLFCGMGNFSIPLAKSANSILGIEGQGAAIRCANRNSTSAGLENTRFVKGDIAQVCTTLTKENHHFDITVIDPPRQGVPNLAGPIASLTREKLIYISCDPATLARDLSELERKGFTTTSIQPFDMFPQTHHIETVAVLEKN